MIESKKPIRFIGYRFVILLLAATAAIVSLGSKGNAAQLAVGFETAKARGAFSWHVLVRLVVIAAAARAHLHGTLVGRVTCHGVFFYDLLAEA